MQFSAIVPVHKVGECPHRQTAFAFVLARMVEADCFAEILIASQGVTVLPFTHHKIKVLTFADDYPDGEIRKSYLINQAALVATSAHIWMNDADVWVPFDRVAEELSGKHTPFCVQPFTQLYRLDEPGTRAFMGDHKIACTAYPTVSCLCGGSVIFDRGLFLWLRGYDERFHGWAPEDAELGNRVRALMPNEKLNIRGVHLYHPRLARNELVAEADRFADIYKPSKALAAADPYATLTTVRSSIPHQWAKDRLDDTAVIWAVYGCHAGDIRDTCHRLAITEAMRMQQWQPNWHLYELVCEDDKPVYADFCQTNNINYHLVKGTESNRVLFQKEALYNMAARELHEDYLICLDADMVPALPTWAADIRSKLMQAPNIAVQPYSKFFDHKAGKSAYSLSAAVTSGSSNMENYRGTWTQPGGCWAVRREFIAQKGFNQMHLTGGGDVGFVHEYIPCDIYRYALERKYYKELRRADCPQAVCESIEATMIHMYHGDYKERAYVWSRESFSYFGSLYQYIRVNPVTGLTEWIDPHCPLRWAMERKAEMQSQKDVEKVIMESFIKTRQMEKAEMGRK